MAPRPRRLDPLDPKNASKERKAPGRAAVLLLVYRHKDKLYTVLTQRAAHLASHSSQVSLPGGRIGRGESVEQAALRETEEELAVSPDCVKILGKLTPLLVSSSNHLIHPVVGWTIRKPAFLANPQEVEEILEIPVSILLKRSTMKQEIWHQRGIKREVPFYQIQGYKVWGATAMVLSEFISVLRSLTPA
jgi:8-oxo-dGTP pyrophosphatase MutT (NUDIX family)